MDDAEAMSFGEALAEAAEKCDGAELGMSEGAIKVAAHRLRPMVAPAFRTGGPGDGGQ